MFEIEFTPRAKKDLRELSKLHKREASQLIEDLRDNPFLGKTLTRGLIRNFSYRIRVYRILYKVDFKDMIVTIWKVEHRATVYS